MAAELSVIKNFEEIKIIQDEELNKIKIIQEEELNKIKMDNKINNFKMIIYHRPNATMPFKSFPELPMIFFMKFDFVYFIFITKKISLT